MNLTNYQKLIDTIGVSKLNDAQKQAYEVVKEGSVNFTDPAQWSEMLADADIRDMYEQHVALLQKQSAPSASTPKPDPNPVMKVSKRPRAKKQTAPKKAAPKIPEVKAEVKPTVATPSKKKSRKAKPKKSASKKVAKPKAPAKKAAPKKVVAKKEVKFPVVVKKLSKELQLIKRTANLHNKNKTVNAIKLLLRDVQATVKVTTDRKPMLNDIANRLTGAIASAEKNNVIEFKPIRLQKDFLQRLQDAVKEPRPKMKVEYLAGPEAGKK